MGRGVATKEHFCSIWIDIRINPLRPGAHSFQVCIGYRHWAKDVIPFLEKVLPDNKKEMSHKWLTRVQIGLNESEWGEIILVLLLPFLGFGMSPPVSRVENNNVRIAVLFRIVMDHVQPQRLKSRPSPHPLDKKWWPYEIDRAVVILHNQTKLKPWSKHLNKLSEI